MMKSAAVRRTGLALIMILLTALAGAGGVAWATHNFDDVPDNSFFGPAINEGAVAGCFTGYNDGTFQPKDNPTRGQFAFWVNNCAGRAAVASAATAPAIVGSGGVQSLETIDVEVGGSGTQFVHLTASVNLSSSDAAIDCVATACGVFVSLTEDSSAVSEEFFFRINESVEQRETVTFTTVVPAASGVHTYSLAADPFFVAGTVLVESPTISAITAPFSAEPRIAAG